MSMNNADIVANLEIIDFTRDQPKLKALHDRSLRLLEDEAIEVAKAGLKIHEEKMKALAAEHAKQAAIEQAERNKVLAAEKAAMDKANADRLARDKAALGPLHADPVRRVAEVQGETPHVS